MNSEEIVRLHEQVARVHRAYRAATSAKGSEEDWWMNGGIHFADIKSEDEWKDGIHNLIHWVGVIRDYVGNAMKPQSQGLKRLRQFVETTPEVAICIDLDNRKKHVEITHENPPGSGRTGWTGLKPRLGEIAVSFAMLDPKHPERDFPGLLLAPPRDPESGELTRLTPSTPVITLRHKHPRPDLVDVLAPVLDENGKRIADALDIAQKAIDRWEQFIRDHGIWPLAKRRSQRK